MDKVVIIPTTGRVMLFHPPVDTPMPSGRASAGLILAAIVAAVHSESLVNVTAFDPNGMPFGVTSVTVKQADDPEPAGPYAEWMAYQQGQAAKPQSTLERLEAEMLAAGHHAYDYLFGKKPAATAA